MDMQVQQAQPLEPGAAFKVGNFSSGQARTEVSRQWMSRPADQKFLSLDKMAASIRARNERTTERVVNVRQLEFVAPEANSIEDTFVLGVSVPGETALVEPTHWSFGQLANLADFPASALRKLPSQLVADVLNYRMHISRDVPEIKTYCADAAIRAATGPNYGRIFDHEIVEAVQRVAGNGVGDMRWKVPGTLDWRTMMYNPNTPVTLDTTTLYASDRDVFLFLVDDRNPVEVGKLPDGSPDYMFRGFYVENSEVGSRKCSLAAFYLRAVCCNRIMWGVENFEEISIRHTSQAPSRFIEEVKPALLSYAERGTASLIEGVRAAKAKVAATTQDEALAFLRGRGFSAKKALNIARRDSITGAPREDGDFPRTAWDFAQAITAEARDVPHADARVEMEMTAKKILESVA